jgi:hypothetical protein
VRLLNLDLQYISIKIAEHRSSIPGVNNGCNLPSFAHDC